MILQGYSLKRRDGMDSQFVLIVVQSVSNISIIKKANKDITTVISATRSILSGQELSLSVAISVWQNGCLLCTTFLQQEREYQVSS